MMGWLGVAGRVDALGPPPPPRIFPVVATPTPSVAPARPSLAPATHPQTIPTPQPNETVSIFLPFMVNQPVGSQPQTRLAGTTNPLQEGFVYTVQPGDTLSDLAVEFGRDVKLMSCVRTEDGEPVRHLIPGERIVIPAPGDLCHVVKPGQTLDQVAAWYGVTPQSLMALPENPIPPDGALRPGQTLLIPNARSRYREPEGARLPRPQQHGWWYGDGHFIWPLPRGSFWISQPFKHGKHMALDLAAPAGTPVYAADTGRVIKAGWSEIGYGYRIIIDHGIDYITLYAHLSEYYVQPGDVVEKGMLIGRVGSTGNSTGPHLHFEIRDYGYLIDPMLVLPK